MKTKSISTVKAGHRYIFRYTPGSSEADVIAAFAELAADPQSDFDWFDAACLSYLMGKEVENQNEEATNP